MNKALIFVKTLCASIAVIVLFIVMIKLNVANGICYDTKTYTLTDIEEYNVLIMNAQMSMYDTKLTFEDADGNTLIVKTTRNTKYVKGNTYSITRGVTLYGPMQQYVKIQGA